MKSSRICSLTGAALLAVFATATVAQTTRSVSLAPAGQGLGVRENENTGLSTWTRAERKSKTLMDRSMGGLTAAGQFGIKPDHMNPAPPQAKNWADVKGETLAAARSRTLQPAGKAPQPTNQPVPK